MYVYVFMRWAGGQAGGSLAQPDPLPRRKGPLVTSFLTGRDVFAVLPTGLCYAIHIPAELANLRSFSYLLSLNSHNKEISSQNSGLAVCTALDGSIDQIALHPRPQNIILRLIIQPLMNIPGRQLDVLHVPRPFFEVKGLAPPD